MAKADEILRRKIDFTDRCVSAADMFGDLAVDVGANRAFYFDNQYNPTGANEITDVLLDQYFSFTASEYASEINLWEQITNFYSNIAVTQGDWASINENIRGNQQQDLVILGLAEPDNSQVGHVNRAISYADTYAAFIVAARDLTNVWNKRGYSAGIVDADLVTYRFDAAQLASFINLLNQFINLNSNQPVATGAYSIVNNTIRTPV